MKRRAFALHAFAITLALLLCGGAGIAAAAEPPQWSPGKPIKIVVPWPPGGVADASGRAIANELSIRLKRPFVVENKPGATGMIGAAYVAASAPDGTTFLLGNVETQVLAPLLFPKTIRYDAEKSFDPVMEAVRIPMAMVERPDLTAQNAQDFARLGKEKSGNLTYGTWGIGSTAHLAFLLLEQQTGVSMTHVPYQGAPPTYAALMRGDIDFLVAQVPWAMNAAKEGKVRVLGLTGASRSALAPALPTMSESGFKDYAFELWMGLYAPKGVPVEIREVLTRELTAWLQTPEARAVLAPPGAEPLYGGASELLARQRNESAFWQRIVKAKNIDIE